MIIIIYLDLSLLISLSFSFLRPFTSMIYAQREDKKKMK
jgi:hypothetical protein